MIIGTSEQDMTRSVLDPLFCKLAEVQTQPKIQPKIKSACTGTTGLGPKIVHEYRGQLFCLHASYFASTRPKEEGLGLG